MSLVQPSAMDERISALRQRKAPNHGDAATPLQFDRRRRHVHIEGVLFEVSITREREWES